MSGPTSLRLRSYNVGFGDCFLLSISYADATRHVLIDFGSTALPRFPDRLSRVAEQIATDCAGKLTMVVATHRHADHIAGFAGPAGRVIAALAPDLVVRPWTEDPALDPGGTTQAAGSARRSAAAGVTTTLAAMQSVATSVALEGARLAGTRRLPRAAAERVRFLGETNLSNAEAVRNLAAMGRNVYAHFGTKLPIAALLPGVRVDVLGPPTVHQSAGVARMASTNAQQYWHLAAQRGGRSARSPTPKPLFPRRKQVPVPLPAKWLIRHIDRIHVDEMLGIVRVLDRALNNTSLILLMQIGSATLLFPGDAQWENWRYALQERPDRDQIIARLAETTVYKVGHHGSLNATPKTLWEAFRHRSPKTDDAARLRTLLSTKSDQHGSSSRGTEVPRGPLVAALEKDSTLVRTSSLRTRFWHDITIDVG